MDTRKLVAIPEDKGIHIKTAGVKREKYVYKYIKYYRNEEGEARSKAKAIGKYDETTGKMQPNGNYYEMYKIDAEMADITVLEYGYQYLIREISKKIGLTESLREAFGKEATDIINIAGYIIREGNAMDGIEDWQQRNYMAENSHILNSQTTSKIFGEISIQGQEAFFKDWVGKAYNGGSVFYDVTSISSYSKEMTEVEWGYNRDGDKLAQFNIGMFCDKETKTALYYNRYNGSLTDKSNLSYVMANANAVGIKEVSMIVDGGFFDEKCFQGLREYCKSFTVGMPGKLVESKDAIAKYGDGIDSYTNKLTDKHHIYCRQIETEIYGSQGRMLLYYDVYSHASKCDEISEEIERLKLELSGLKRYPRAKLARYKPYFTIAKHRDGNGFDYSVDAQKVEKLRKDKGYFLIFTTEKDLSPSDILAYYRDKDADEKLFSQIKVDMDGSRIRTHSTQTTVGKVFVTFIACLIRNYIMHKLSGYLSDHSTSLKKIFNQLSNIIIIKGVAGFRFTKALTKNQRSILSTFDLANDIITSLKT